MDFSLINTSWPTLLMVVLATLSIYIVLMILNRVAGLRSFSKMSGFDFVVTIAIGSMLANTIVTKKPILLVAVVAFVTLFLLQAVVAWLRSKHSLLIRLADNTPLLLMDGPTMLEENMDKVNITTEELHARLREANVAQLSQVKAVVMETTGDLSVVHHSDPTLKVDPELLENIRQ